MLTQERPTDDVVPGSRVWIWLVIVLIIAGGAVAAFWLFGDDAVPARDAEPTVTFDGQTAEYDGPELIRQDGLITFTFTSTHTGEHALAVFKFADEAAADAYLSDFPIGADRAGFGVGRPELMVTAIVGGIGLEEMSTSVDVGFYLLQIATFEDDIAMASGITDRLWNVATFEVIE